MPPKTPPITPPIPGPSDDWFGDSGLSRPSSQPPALVEGMDDGRELARDLELAEVG